MAFMNAMALGATIKVGLGGSIGQLRKLGSAFNHVRSASKKVAGQMGSMAMAAGALGAAGAGITAVLAGMSSKAATFEAQMSAVGAVMLKGKDEINDLTKAAKRLGATTVFSASQVGEGMESMARAGFSIIDIIGPDGKSGGIKGVLDAAAASGMGLAETANHVSNVLKGMGLEASEAGRVADVLAVASSKTNSSIGSLGESIKNVASTAKQFQIPLEEVVAGVALLQDVGLDASVAGSSMNTMLTKMATMSTGTKKKLTALGVAFEDTEHNMLPFPVVLDNIAKASRESGGNMEAAAMLAEMFGLRGQKAAANLQDLAESGRFSELVETLKQAEGKASEMAALRLDNLTGQFTLLSSATEGFAIEAMGPLNEELKEGVINITELMSAITMGMQGEGDGAASDFGKGLMEGITAIADGMKWLREQFEGWMDSVGEGETNWAKTAGIITVAIVAIMLVLTPVLLAIGAIAAIAFLLGEALIPVLVVVAAIAGVIGLAFVGMFAAAEAKGVSFMGMIKGLWAAMVEMWEGGKAAFMENWTVVEEAFAPGLASLKDAWTSITDLFADRGPQTTATFTDIGRAVGKWAAGTALVVGWIFQLVAWLIKAGVAMTTKFMEPGMNAIDQILGGFLDLITGTGSVTSAIGRMFFGLSMLMTVHIRGAINSILEMFKLLIDNPAAQAMFALFGIDTTAALNNAQEFIADPPMPEWMESTDEASTLSARLLGMMQDTDADVATPPDPEVVVNNDVKNCVDITNRLSVAGREVAIAEGEHHQDIADRTGKVVAPYQRRQILEHGAAML
jgi:TP901 family phage tail tape measure protein